MDSIKQAIIENAKIEFLRHDYDDVCLIEICRNAGITTGAFYRRFYGKKELIWVIVDSAMSGFKEEIKKYQIKVYNQSPNENMEHNWLLVLVYRYRDGIKIMLRHMSIMEKDTYLEELVEILMDVYNIEKNNFAHIAFRSYLTALIETTLYYKNSQDAESCMNKIRKLICSGIYRNMTI